jgi:hypothetical protein
MDAIDGWMDAMVYKIDEPISFSSFYFSCYYVYIIAHVAFRSFVCLLVLWIIFYICLMIIARSSGGSCLTTRWSCCCGGGGCGKLMWHNIFCFLVVGGRKRQLMGNIL